MSATATDTRISVSTPAQIIRSVWNSFTAKRAAAAAGRPHRTVEGWLAGRGEPSLSDALRMAAADAAFRSALSDELAAISARVEGMQHELRTGRDLVRGVAAVRAGGERLQARG